MHVIFIDESELERFKTAKMTFKVIDIGAIRLDKCYFRLLFHYTIVPFSVYEILALISQNFKRSCDPECTL